MGLCVLEHFYRIYNVAFSFCMILGEKMNIVKEDQIEAVLWDISEDDLDDTDSEDESTGICSDNLEEYMEVIEENVSEPENSVAVSKDVRNKPLKIPKGTLKWRKGNYIAMDDNLAFDQHPLPNDLLELKTPYEFFKKLFPSSLIDKIVAESNLLATQKDVNTNFNVTSVEIYKFIGICLYSSVSHSNIQHEELLEF